MSKKTSTKKTAPKTGKSAGKTNNRLAAAVIDEIQKRVDDLEAQEATVETAIPAAPGEPIPPKNAPKGKRGRQAKPAAEPKPAKPAKAPMAEKPAKTKKVSLLDAAAAYLKMHASVGHKTKDIVAAAPSLGWVAGVGKTPEASLYAAMIREIDAKGKESRFVKLDKGVFQASKSLLASEA